MRCRGSLLRVGQSSRAQLLFVRLFCLQVGAAAPAGAGRIQLAALHEGRALAGAPVWALPPSTRRCVSVVASTLAIAGAPRGVHAPAVTGLAGGSVSLRLIPPSDAAGAAVASYVRGCMSAYAFLVRAPVRN